MAPFVYCIYMYDNAQSIPSPCPDEVGDCDEQILTDLAAPQ